MAHTGPSQCKYLLRNYICFRLESFEHTAKVVNFINHMEKLENHFSFSLLVRIFCALSSQQQLNENLTKDTQIPSFT